jgi:hypothetical protein
VIEKWIKRKSPLKEQRVDYLSPLRVFIKSKKGAEIKVNRFKTFGVLKNAFKNR